MKIKEIIVVEGKDDTVAIKRAVDADTIETNGSAINEETINKIRLAQKKRGVIIFTDPDFPGEKIRKQISEKVPGCIHAFLPKHAARPKSGKGIGVEHASPEDIREALKCAHVMNEESSEEITVDELMKYGLLGGEGAKARRERLGEILKIGYANGKQLHKRLMMFQISKSSFLSAIKQMNQEDYYE
jgi:ribonuclease M5